MLRRSFLALQTRIARDQIGRLAEQIAFGPRVDSTTRIARDQLRMAFTYKRSITVDHTKVSATLTDFPMLVSVTHDDLRSVGNGGHVEHSSGYDVCFYSDSAGTSVLTWEMERYNPVTGEVIAWVKIPSLSSTVDTIIWLFYGDATISTFQSTPTAVWDSSYAGVWHFPDASGPVEDSTSNNRDGTNTSVIASVGQIGSAGTWDGGASADRVVTPAFTSTTTRTISCWFYLTAVDATARRLWDWQSPDRVFFDTTYLMAFQADYNTADGSWRIALPSTGAWHHLVITLDGSSAANDPVIYLDGVPQSVTEIATPSGSMVNTNIAMIIGNRAGNDRVFNGRIDEFRRREVISSADLVATEWASQGDPATFSALGAEQSTAVARRGSLALLGVG